MTVVDEDLLALFRVPGECELCGVFCQAREPHHVWARGMGAGSRLDVRVNLVALGGTFRCSCHSWIHAGFIPKRAVVSVVALREGMTVDGVISAVHRLLRAPKGSDVQAILEAKG